MLRFDNLSGDASLDWIATAAPAILGSQLAGVGRVLPALAENARDGYLQRATHLAHGYFEKRGERLRFEVVVEDAGRHRISAEDTAEGDALEAMDNIAHRMSPAARPFSTSNREALEAWGRAEFERAVTLDPDFGGAWLSWVQSLAAAGDAARAREIASRALARGGLRASLEKAQIDVIASNLERGSGSGDSAQIKALENLSRLAPLEAAPLRALAQAHLGARRFAEAARAYENLIQADPGDAQARNLLGYAQALAGDPDRARASFEQYGRQSGEAANALDSLGEAMFLNGRFREAEKAFLDSFQKSPDFLGGATLWKAAHARWLGGDLAGANELASRYSQARMRARDPSIVWRQANWLYETGRRNEAMALLMRAPPEAAEAAKRQLAVWENPEAAIPRDLAMLEQLYQHTDPTKDALARTFYAKALLEAGRKDEARKLTALWPLPPLGASPLESMVYPEFLELRKNLQ